MQPLFDSIYEALIKKNLEGEWWQADETRWSVFVLQEGKVGYRWYMWMFRSSSSVVYYLDPTRSSKVPKAHFGKEIWGILLVDRYSAYKAMIKINGIILAFCWAHVRRDFLDLARDRPQQEAWAMEWVESIGNLYHLNDLRIQALEDPSFGEKDQDLRDAIGKMEQQSKEELENAEIHPARPESS